MIVAWWSKQRSATKTAIAFGAGYLALEALGLGIATIWGEGGMMLIVALFEINLPLIKILRLLVTTNPPSTFQYIAIFEIAPMLCWAAVGGALGYFWEILPRLGKHTKTE